MVFQCFSELSYIPNASSFHLLFGFIALKKRTRHGIHITQDLSGGDVCIEFGAVNVWKTQIEE